MANCRSCGAPIRWAVSDGSGKKVPLDPEPVVDGNIVVVDRPGHTLVVRFLKKDRPLTRDGLRYVSHFATCPNSARHRKK